MSFDLPKITTFTLSNGVRVHTPCPLICLWHSTPVFHFDSTVFCDKYHLNGLLTNVLKTRFGNWLLVQAHDIINVLAFTYVTACADKFVLLSKRFIPIFFPAKLFPNKVTGISNFISRELMDVIVDTQEKKNEVLFMGRLDNKHKRLDLLLQIWEKVEKKYAINNWKLNICGGGSDADKLKQMKDDLGLQNVYFRGVVSPEEWYRAASVFCMTSEVEGCPMVLGEAAAYACVLMAFDAFESSYDWISDNENGRLLKAFDIDAYAEALDELIENKDYRMRLAENAKRDVQKFGPDVIMDEWE